MATTANATKLTLRLEGGAIERGKQYAKERGTSVSKLVEAYLNSLITIADDDAEKEFVKVDPEIARLFPSRPEFSGRTDQELTEGYYAALLERTK